jgi:ankyrin repeat protein
MTCLAELLRAGARVNDCNYFGTTPLLCAVLNRNAAAVRMLCEAGANVHTANKLGHTPMSSVLFPSSQTPRLAACLNALAVGNQRCEECNVTRPIGPYLPRVCDWL